MKAHRILFEAAVHFVLQRLSEWLVKIKQYEQKKISEMVIISKETRMEITEIICFTQTYFHFVNSLLCGRVLRGSDESQQKPRFAWFHWNKFSFNSYYFSNNGNSVFTFS